MRGLGERAAGVEVFADGGVVPVGEVGDEVEQRLAQRVVVVEQGRLLLDLEESRETLRPLELALLGRPRPP